MDKFTCFLNFVECQTVSTYRTNAITATSTSSISSVHQVFDLFTPWCAAGPVPQIIRLNFNDSTIYLTQLRVTGNSATVRVLYDTHEILYRNTLGIMVRKSLCN